MTPFQKYLRLYLPVIFAMILVAGIYLGKYLNSSQSRQLFIQPHRDKLSTIIQYINTDYVDTVNTDALIEKVIPGLLENLDPHSVYIPARDHERVNEPLIGNFEGIGVQFKIQDDTIAIVKVIPNGPSDKVGIHDGDRIILINDSLVAGVNIDENNVMNLLRGEKGTLVTISILRRDNPDLIDFTITRDKIPLYSVDVSFETRENIGYIKISKFGQTTHDEFIEAVQKLKKNSVAKLIIDLRGNSGGYLDAATRIADEFLSSGNMIVYTQGKSRPRQTVYSTNRGLCENDEVVILQDDWSASASEILAGAIQDNDRGLIIGRRSFGKGLVQEQTVFRDGSSMRLTTARYYTPTGRSIQKPYDHGIQDYHNDIGKRFHNGEFEVSDSIHLNDSLVYKTPSGKTVYGGGGIMPDIFIPIDTSGSSEYLALVTRKGLLYHFAFEYADLHRTTLHEYQSWEKTLSYLKKKEVLNEFIQYASKKGVKKNEADIEVSKDILENQLYALITRNILDNDGFYPILLSNDKTYLRAVEELTK